MKPVFKLPNALVHNALQTTTDGSITGNPINEDARSAAVENSKNKVSRLKAQIEKEKDKMDIVKTSIQRKKELERDNKQRAALKNKDEHGLKRCEAVGESAQIQENGRSNVTEPIRINGKIVGYVTRNKKMVEFKDRKGQRVSFETELGTFTNSGAKVSGQKVGLMILGIALAAKTKRK